MQFQFIRQNQTGNAHINGITPSYFPISIIQSNQNTQYRSKLSQDRRQSHQEKHQNYPQTGGKITRKNIKIIPFWDIDNTIFRHFASYFKTKF